MLTYRRCVLVGIFSIGACFLTPAKAEITAGNDGKLLVGWATADITPEQPVLISGQLLDT